METTTKSLHFKWTVSKGQYTYGYNICTLWVDGEKVARCMGGGYDMQGTCLGEWLENNFQDRLKETLVKNGEIVKSVMLDGRTYPREIYGARLLKDNVALDGAAGFGSMQDIAEAIGVKLHWDRNSDRYKNLSIYTAEILEPVHA